MRYVIAFKSAFINNQAGLVYFGQFGPQYTPRQLHLQYVAHDRAPIGQIYSPRIIRVLLLERVTQLDFVGNKLFEQLIHGRQLIDIDTFSQRQILGHFLALFDKELHNYWLDFGRNLGIGAVVRAVVIVV